MHLNKLPKIAEQRKRKGIYMVVGKCYPREKKFYTGDICHSGFGSNLDHFSSKPICNFFSLKLFCMAKLGLQGISY